MKAAEIENILTSFKKSNTQVLRYKRHVPPFRHAELTGSELESFRDPHVYPRLYRGEVENAHTSVFFELPVSRNYRYAGWDKAPPFFRPAYSAGQFRQNV